LKTPVEKAQNLTVLLKKDFSTIFPQKALEYIDKMSFNLHQMDGQTNDLVELARISFQKLKFQEFNSVDLVEYILKSIPGLLSENHIKIIYGEKLPRINADYEGMKRVFFNLIINAVKATEKTENPTIKIGCKEYSWFFEFYVKDNGAPIPGKQRKSIFEIFPAGSNGSLDRSRLAVVKKIIDLHRGKIWLESNNGSGNTFIFKLYKKGHG
ncbi:MAG: HAMP domain-containing histidine kinase, partial [Calditrichaeota bacterium]|nr:HAMP domain-containing histidine kinase [Calditrichota bacterium]